MLFLQMFVYIYTEQAPSQAGFKSLPAMNGCGFRT